MINAIYFKSLWQNKFDPQLTEKQTFHNINNKVKQVSMMYKSANFSFGISEDFNAQLLEIPYQVNIFELF